MPWGAHISAVGRQEVSQWRCVHYARCSGEREEEGAAVLTPGLTETSTLKQGGEGAGRSSRGTSVKSQRLRDLRPQVAGGLWGQSRSQPDAVGKLLCRFVSLSANLSQGAGRLISSQVSPSGPSSIDFLGGCWGAAKLVVSTAQISASWGFCSLLS